MKQGSAIRQIILNVVDKVYRIHIPCIALLNIIVSAWRYHKWYWGKKTHEYVLCIYLRRFQCVSDIDIRDINTEIWINIICWRMSRLRKIAKWGALQVVAVGGVFAIKETFFTDRHARVRILNYLYKICMLIVILYNVKYCE